MEKIFIAILGVGTVGKAVIDILQNNQDIITARAGVSIIPKIAIARNIDNKNISIPLSTDINDALNDKDIEIIVELIGGIELPYSIALQALERNKAFVTANKAMLAYHRHDLEVRNNGIPIGFEASVCGAIPIIRVLRDGLCANHIISIRGIMNGTSNYILTQMSQKNESFESALKQAQELGYAEANPALDINGSDSAHKLLILASLAYGINAKIDDIIVEGIEGLTLEDINFARGSEYEIKLLGVAKKTNNQLELRAHLAMIPKDCMLAKVSGVMNAISVVGDNVGEMLYYGAGAGGSQTASSVISDIIEIARNKVLLHNIKNTVPSESTPHSMPMLGYANDTYSIGHDIELMPRDKISCCYYIRLKVRDKLGVLSNISHVFALHQISIKSLIQKNPKNLDSQYAYLLLSTHICTEAQIQKALSELSILQDIIESPFMIRIDNL
ncbi:homoserine dehydrogenase [Helicobacter muridarum]|uniref:Homoserine dehydrogenase n=1 Tax=Helicobacter muridarum TaxID=216 RepID=A0A4U8TPB5_9HELI|nr:homoserine dehydrogenase [Helicobacter muridarum]TLE00738.1 homoserine dehydrogenase [Helicobacter muridarum]